MDTITQRANELKKYLYFNHIESSDIDKVNIQKNLFLLLRECIKNQKYVVEVGDYELNVSLDNLYVKYETEDTLIEVSKDDIHFENVFVIPDQYFVISNVEKEEYSIDNPAILVTGAIDNYDDNIKEYYEVSISDNVDEDIRNYIVLNNNFTYTNDDFDTKYTVTIKREGEINSSYPNIYSIFNKNKIFPVTYNATKDNYVKREITPNNYEKMIPKFNDQKLLVSYIYGLIVEFYTEYTNNN